MSEYQYYEFQAIDRMLRQADREALRKISSRAAITSTRFTNSYEWGDFKGDPNTLMERWFDLHFYRANWGSRRLMLKLPTRMVDRDVLDRCLGKTDSVEVWEAGDSLILSIARDELDIEDWDVEDDGRLATLAPLRSDVLAGDTRLFYLLWLMAIEDGEVEDEALEPLPGIGPLTDALEAFAEFFGMDPDLVAAAAERTGDPMAGRSASSEAVRQIISAIAETEKTDLLARLHDGDGLVASELRALVRRRQAPATDAPLPARCAGELRARAEAIRLARENAQAAEAAAERKRLEEEAERNRRVRLDALIGRGESVWSDIEAEIERRNARGYDKATEILLDLRTVAEERGTTKDFTGRLEAIRERHAGKRRFIDRLEMLA